MRHSNRVTHSTPGKGKLPFINYDYVDRLESSYFFIFSKLHKDIQSMKEPAVNMIKAAMIEQNFGKEDYYKMEQDYNISESRIRDSISSAKVEKIVIESLCKYLDVSYPMSLYNVIANYDFELKDIAKKGMRGSANKKEFLEEYRKSWSDKTVQKYIQEIEEHDESNISDDDEMDRIENDIKKRCFQKLNTIYDKYPDEIYMLCKKFSELNEE